jgi:hypothetical protein
MMDTAETKRRYDLAAARRSKTARGALAVVLAGVLAGALLIALGGGGPASAASRGFSLDNKSDLSLRLYKVQPVPTFLCVDPGRCVQTHHPIDFEGRPNEGDVLNPNQSHRFELKYGFSLLGGVQYAANLWYKIQGNNDPDDNVYWTIETYSTSNESSCKINHTSKYDCKAEGTQLTFKNR